MTLKNILLLLETADSSITEAYKLCDDLSAEKQAIGAILLPLFDCTQSVKLEIAEIEREERRKYQG